MLTAPHASPPGPFGFDPCWYQSWKDVRDEDIAKVTQLLKRGILSVVAGGVMEQFEQRFARFAGTQHAVALNNGTAALYAALWAVGVRAGDDVLICDYGFHGMAAAALTLGARLVPVDCRPESLTLDPADIARRLTPRTRAILIHHPWGVPAELGPIRAAAQGVPIISDASHAHGASYGGQPLARWADVTCFSLGLGKLISGGELGCAVTDSLELRDRMLTLGHVNRVPAGLKGSEWNGSAVGLKLRPHPVALALALGQLERFEEKLSYLRATCSRLEEGFRHHGLLPQVPPEGSARAYWRLVLRLDPGRFGDLPTAKVEESLRAHRIPVEPNHYWPSLQHQDIFRWPDHQERVLRNDCPVVQAVAPRTVTLPAPVLMTPEQISQAIDAAGQAVASALGASSSQS